MTIFVAHEYGGWPVNIDKAKRVLRWLQSLDPKNTYICPLSTMEYSDYISVTYQEELKLCLDTLQHADRLIVVGSVTDEIRSQVQLAKQYKMPISYYQWHPERINPIHFLHF